MEASNNEEVKKNENEEESKKKDREEELERNEKKESKERNKNEVGKFMKLFDEVLLQNKGNLSDADIATSVEEAVKYFKQCISGACDREKYNDRSKLCAFFYRYSPLYAGTTRNRILTAFRNCLDFKSCFHHPSLKIVDIASGAGGDMVGLYSALYEEGFPFEFLEVTAMDYNKNWQVFFEDIEKKLREDDFGNASRLFKEKKINCSFVCFDVLNEDCKMEKKILKADMILMKGFLSVLNDDLCRRHVIENVSSAMKPGSFLVIIESPTYERYFQRKNLRLVFTTREFESENPHVPSADDLDLSTPQNTSVAPLDSNLTTQVPSSNSENQNSTSQSPQSDSQKDNSVLQVPYSEFCPTWENYDPYKKPIRIDKFPLCGCSDRKYGKGVAAISNQEIFVLVKE